MNAVFRFFYKLSGWKVIGEIPQEVKKGVLVVCPHLYTADFFVGLGARATMRRKIGYLGKSELFKPPFGFIFRALGGTPVYRSESHNLVESMIQAVNHAENGLITVAPEGTRKNVQKLKTGFYYIADGAKIPLILVGFDYVIKAVVISAPIMTSGNFIKDLNDFILPFFEGINGEKKDWFYNYKKGIYS